MRCLPGSVVAAPHDAGVFRSFIPRVLGGAESDPVAFCRMVEELARIDGTTGWCSRLCGAYGLV
jgi:alkylation response protein AidB-like acyl-CoA dehydrogenase